MDVSFPEFYSTNKLSLDAYESPFLIVHKGICVYLALHSGQFDICF